MYNAKLDASHSTSLTNRRSGHQSEHTHTHTQSGTTPIQLLPWLNLDYGITTLNRFGFELSYRTPLYYQQMLDMSTMTAILRTSKKKKNLSHIKGDVLR